MSAAGAEQLDSLLAEEVGKGGKPGFIRNAYQSSHHKRRLEKHTPVIFLTHYLPYDRRL